MKKLFIALLASLVLLTGCYNSKPTDKMLAMFNDDSLVAQEWDSFSNGMKNRNRSNFISSKTRDFSGSDTVWYGELSPDDIITIEYSAKVSKGDFKIVLVNGKEASVTTLWHSDEPSAKTQNYMQVVQQEGWYRIKIVGIHTDSRFDISVDTAKAT